MLVEAAQKSSQRLDEPNQLPTVVLDATFADGPEVALVSILSQKLPPASRPLSPKISLFSLKPFVDFDFDDGVSVMVEKPNPFRPATSNDLANRGKKSLFIISKVRFLREGIAGVIEQSAHHFLAGSFENVDEISAAARGCGEMTVLLDAAFPNGLAAIRELRAVNAESKLVVFALSETEENIVAWAQAGADGYIPRTASLNELVRFIESIVSGEQICSAAITSRLIRRLGSYTSGSPERSSYATLLTSREREIMKMIAKGCSNKEIARALRIELSTTKSHVHNLLRKVKLQRRGQISEWAHKTGGW